MRAAHSASSFETRARLRARDSKDCVPCPPLPRGHGARGLACRDCVECPARAFAHPTNVDAQIRRCRDLGTPGVARSCGPIPCCPMSSPGIGTRRPRGKSSRARGWAWAVDAGNRLASPAMGDDAGEALLAPMKRAELRSRAIIEILASHSCLHWSARMVCVSRMRCSTTRRTRSCKPARTVSARRGVPLIRDLRRVCVLLW